MRRRIQTPNNYAWVRRRIYTTYLTRKMPTRLHAELKRMARYNGTTIQDALNSCLEVGIKYHNQAAGLQDLPQSAGQGLIWELIDDDGTGESNYMTKGGIEAWQRTAK